MKELTISTSNRCGVVGLAAITPLFLNIGCSTSKDEIGDGRAHDHKYISSEINKSLKEEPIYKFSDVRVDTFAGIVQLSGFVNTDTQRKRAEVIARGKGGVKGVANGLTLNPVALQLIGPSNVASCIYAEPQLPVTPNTSH